jgi:hypothetical protein
VSALTKPNGTVATHAKTKAARATARGPISSVYLPAIERESPHT